MVAGKTIVALAAGFALLVTASAAFAGSLEDGAAAMNRQDYAAAYRLFKGSTDPRALHNIGLMAEAGVIPDCDMNCALGWFRKAVDRDYVPSLTRIGAIWFNAGEKDKGVNIIKYAARWGDGNAGTILRQMNVEVPQPDLLDAYNRQRAALAQQQRQAQAQSQQNLAFALGAFYSGYASQMASRPPLGFAQNYGSNLVGQSLSGYQTVCTYQVPTGQVQVITGGGCPARYP